MIHRISDQVARFISIVARAGGRPVSKFAILDLLWGDEERSANILTVYVRKIRRKIEDDPDQLVLR